jgi:hypothetical protein
MALPGVATASASALTGSVLVTYNGHMATREQIIGTIELCRDTLSPSGSMRLDASYPTFGGGAVAHPLVQAIVETLVEHALKTALAIVI